jgi:hypothetical protein
MRLARLTGLEQDKIVAGTKTLIDTIGDLGHPRQAARHGDHRR